MIVTREKLINLALKETKRQAAKDDVLSGYLIGSVAGGKPLLGGAADIDLVLIHSSQPIVRRQFIPLSNEVHLDITHNHRSLYESPKDLRLDPWLGPSMCEPVFLYDPEHFFEWSQAGVRGQFHRPDHVRARALAFLERARRGKAALDGTETWLEQYAKILLEGANAAACLEGFPAAGRRLALILENRAHRLGHPEVFTGFLSLLGSESIDSLRFPEWMTAFGRAYDVAVEAADQSGLRACRRVYYLSGFQALAEAGRPEAAIWTLLTTWQKVMQALSDVGLAGDYWPVWENCLAQLQLTPEGSAARESQLESYLDQIELVIEDWSDRKGA